MEHLAVLEHEGAHAVRFAGLDRVLGAKNRIIGHATR
jgi:hypothetical protein